MDIKKPQMQREVIEKIFFEYQTGWSFHADTRFGQFPRHCGG
jgi:hypothetical protein